MHTRSNTALPRTEHNRTNAAIGVAFVSIPQHIETRDQTCEFCSFCVCCSLTLSFFRTLVHSISNGMDHENKIYENVPLEFYIFSRKLKMMLMIFGRIVLVCVYVCRLLIVASVYTLLAFHLCDALLLLLYLLLSLSLCVFFSVSAFIILSITVLVFSAFTSKPNQFSNFATDSLRVFFRWPRTLLCIDF